MDDRDQKILNTYFTSSQKSKNSVKIKLESTYGQIDKLVTMAEMGLGAVRPLNKEKGNGFQN